jgi:hypothetical protein
MKKVDLIIKISLLKQKIDQCLDVRDREGFNLLALELKVCQHYLETCFQHTDVRFKKPGKQYRDKFLKY